MGDNMSCFNIHFFKESPSDGLSTSVDATEIIEYLEQKGIFRITSADDKAIIYYDHPRLPYSARIVMTKGSILTNLYRLNPKYRDAKIHLEIDVNIPNYVAKEFLEIAVMLSDRFSFKTYNEFLEDVGRFNLDLYLSVFDTFKEAYLDKNPAFSERFIKIGESKMNAILKYLDEKPNLERFFRDNYCAVPKYHFLKTEDHKIKLAINWVENTATIFPPFIDYIYYRCGELIYLYDAGSLFDVIEGYLENVPGFIKEARLVSLNNIKKVTKLVKKSKLIPLVRSFNKSDLIDIID